MRLSGHGDGCTHCGSEWIAFWHRTRHEPQSYFFNGGSGMYRDNVTRGHGEGY